MNAAACSYVEAGKEVIAMLQQYQPFVCCNNLHLRGFVWLPDDSKFTQNTFPPAGFTGAR